MKVLTKNVDDSIIESYMGKKITILCVRYFYIGTLCAIDGDLIKISGARKVYELGKLETKNIESEESFNRDWVINVNAIESFGELKD